MHAFISFRCVHTHTHTHIGIISEEEMATHFHGYSCLENSHEQKSLAGYSLWGHKESDMTEHTQDIYTYIYVYMCIMCVCAHL